MLTERLSVNNPADLIRAVELLKSGALVAVPTETVYGLAADASNPDAVKEIFRAKGRPADHPLITHIASPEAIQHWAINVPDWVTDLCAEFWPGPLTLILEKHDRVPEVITGGHPTIGLRMPNQPALLQLLQQEQLAIAAPSANPYQRLSPTSADQVLAGLEGKIAAVLDAGPCQVGTESTILSVVGGRAKLLRAGSITATQLQPYVPLSIDVPKQHLEAVSGNKEIHYRPGTPVYLKSMAEIREADLGELRIGQINHSGAMSRTADICRNLGSDAKGYRHHLYATLYEFDQLQLDAIWVERVPDNEEWADIADRLQKAAN